MGKITAAITGVGEYLPDYILTNDELSHMVDTNDEWIMSHTGIKTRHILKGEGIGSSYMGARAVINLLDKTGVDPMSIDAVICATVTPDMFFPSTGNLIADQAGCKNAFAYDVSAACSGFLFALTTGAKFIEAGSCKRVIVVGGRAVGAMRRIAQGDFRSNAELGGRAESVSPDGEAVRIAERAAALLGLDYCGVDLLPTADGYLLCEVNSNAFFGTFERVTGINVAARYAEHIIAAMSAR